MISEEEFLMRVKGMPRTIYSKTRKVTYSKFRIEDEILYFLREVPATDWALNLKELYCVYKENDFINTSVIKKQTRGRVNSPSVAILIAIRCIDERGNRI